MDSESDHKRKHKYKKQDKKVKKDKKHKHKKKSKKEYSSSSSEEDEWIEKTRPEDVKPKEDLERDDWMSSKLIPTYSKEKKIDDKKVVVDKYDPQLSSRELNPHWRNGGTGLPSFKKPSDEYEAQIRNHNTRDSAVRRTPGWKKDKKPASSHHKIEEKEEEPPVVIEKVVPAEGLLTNQQLNELGAKLIKAELLGNLELAKELKEKLEKAKTNRNEHKQAAKEEDEQQSEIRYVVSKSSAPHDNSRDRKKTKKHHDSLPVSDLSDKFRSEKYENENLDAQFFKISTKLDKSSSNLENIFDHEKASSSTSGRANEEKTVKGMNDLNQAQIDCDKCMTSSKFRSDFIISFGKYSYVAVPSWKGLQSRHCIIVPMQHCPALTHLDEDDYREMTELCRALTRMFADHKQDVIFFESVRYINRNPHAYIQCVPSGNFEMAPFYFKKAIQESETEWAMNKKLHDIQGIEIRKTIPKGLPYFWVNFNMENGFAHVIEDQEYFQSTFAQEIIAGILNLDTNSWRRPGKEYNPLQKVQEFQKWWKSFDITNEKL